MKQLPPATLPPVKKAWTRQQRYSFLGLAVLLVAGMGVGLSFLLLRPYQQDGLNQVLGREVLVENIELGKLVPDANPKALNPPIRQTSSFAQGEGIVMRMTTTELVTNPFEVGVRLLTEKGGIIELSPPAATFLPGVSSFCCWTVEEAGNYSLQIFRPEKIITSLPIEITQTSNATELKPGAGIKFGF